MPLVIPNTFVTTTPIVAADVNANFAAVATKFSGNIVDADLNASAGLSLSKLAGQYEHIYAHMHIDPRAGGLAATGIFASYPIYSDGGGNWTVQQVAWACGDVGDSLAVFNIEFGYWTNANLPVWSMPGDAHGAVLASALHITKGAAALADTPFQGTVAPTAATLDITSDATQRVISARCTTVSATTCTAGALDIVVVLRRPITAT